MPPAPLSVLDLVPISSGSDAGDALRNTIDLAQQAERFGYRRYWVAEHHLNPGVAGTSPAVVLALIAHATSTIRLGSGAVLLGHRTPLATVEEFGLLEALYPGRIDLGVGRSGRPAAPDRAPVVVGAATEVVGGRAPNGLVVPEPFSFAHLIGSPRFALQKQLLQQPDAVAPDYASQIADILSLLRGIYRSVDGVEAHAVPGEGADLELWILGSSGGESAAVAGLYSLPFAANYHVSPGTVLEAVEAYRAAFVASAERDRPYVAVSADVVVADDEVSAREMATGYAAWVRSIRRGEGAIPFPSPQEARAFDWTAQDRELVSDRLQTQFVGTATQVADRLEQLREATDADELVVTTTAHVHRDRVRSYELLAQEWRQR